ncbi:GNAT family N-acetyltransferase [Pontibacter ruber]|uniref:GNAT family N-acetyltransferase n=1 Tax=Pontibacter ruber TaxID=1343895 RepID=A0ABW5D0N2_9BACT|nr:GNAT family N-acetyltransferase [Pontibacter ruber]
MIRAYTRDDNEELIALLQLNIPQYFAESEVNDYIEYLDQHADNYFVVEEDGNIIGAGGYNLGFDEGKTARISWDIVHPAFQGKGIGKALTLHRIEHINKNPAIDRIVVRTTQLVYKFYQKLGFELEKTEKDYWAKGFDLYQMSMFLDNHTSANHSQII